MGAISGIGGSTVTVTFGGTNTVTLTASAFNHAVGNATQLVNGLNLGRDSASTSSTGRIILTAAPTLVGTTVAIATGINTGVQNTQIVPFLLGETTATTGGLGTVTGVANTFMTYNATTGLRPLNLTDEFASNVITSGMNTYVTSAVSVAASDAINSLIVNGADVSIDDGATLTNSSGAILFTSSQAIKPTAATGALAFGAARRKSP